MKIARLLLMTAVAALDLTALGQRANSQGGTAPQPVKTYAFEVASIRQNHSGMNRATGRFLPDRYLAENVSLEDVIGNAYIPTDGGRYKFADSGLLGLPDWAKSEHYNIEATVAESDMAALKGGEVKRLLLQSLLADRFHLKVHIETREQQVYELVVAKTGFKLRSATLGDPYANGIKNLPSDLPRAGICLATAPGEITAQGATMGHLVALLSWLDKTLVLDKTGLTGNYDFKVKWAIDDKTGQPFIEPDISWGVPAPRDSSGVTLSAALQEQLGLKLDSKKGPVQVLVIDHIDPPPEN